MVVLYSFFRRAMLHARSHGRRRVMGDPSDTVDAYLDSRFRTGLEQVLLDATGGYVSPALARTIGVIGEQFDARRHPDGGVSEGYTGTLTVEGLTYQFRCWIYHDIDGRRIVSDLSEFSPTEWKTGIRMSSGGGPRDAGLCGRVLVPGP
jgi:hypothetical protein